MAPPRDPKTLDMFEDYMPPALVRRYPEERVRTASLRARIARGVAETLRECSMDRAEVARLMAEFLDEDVTKNMLDAYASEARAEHTIPYLRLAALVHVTGDHRLLQLLADLFGLAVIDKDYLPWVEYGQAAEKRDELNRIMDAARRHAKKGPR